MISQGLKLANAFHTFCRILEDWTWTKVVNVAINFFVLLQRSMKKKKKKKKKRANESGLYYL